LTFARDPKRSRLCLQERELEPGDNAFIIHSRSNHNYENFTVGSYQVGSGIGSGIGSGRVSGHLVSGHFGSWVVSGWVGSGIGSSSVRSFRVSGRVSGHFRSRVVSGRVGSGIWSSSVRSFRVSGCISSDIGSFSVGLFRVMNRIGSERIRTDSATSSEE
jgi:hypothetical protein